MKLHYYLETDSLYIELNGTQTTETRELSDGVNVDYGANGIVVGIDIDNASGKIDLTTLETSTLPFTHLMAP